MNIKCILKVTLILFLVFTENDYIFIFINAFSSNWLFLFFAYLFEILYKSDLYKCEGNASI